MGGSYLSLPCLVMLISFTQCAKKLLTVIVLESKSASLFVFFNFYRKADVYTVGVYVIVFCQKYLKIKLFHVFVGGVGNFLSGVDVVQHALNC